MEMLPSPIGVHFVAFPRARVAHTRYTPKTLFMPALLQPHTMANVRTDRLLLRKLHNNARLEIDYLTHGGYLPLLMV